MIKRFKSIKQVGIFKHHVNQGNTDFSKFTVIYGLNAFGKSTIKEIFCSLNEDNPDYLEDRKTLPLTNNPIIVEIDILDSNGNLLNPTKYESKQWSNNTSKDKFYIFDNDFIHKNLLSGNQITRENKEAFTDFILGESGVKLSDDLKDVRKDIADFRSSLRTIENILTKILPKDKIEDFIAFQFSESTEQLKASKRKLELELKNLNSLSKLKHLPDLSKNFESICEKLELIQKEIIELLKTDYIHINENALNLMQDHIRQNTSNAKDIERWLKDGTKKHCSKDNCPYCGQSLDNVDSLVDAYTNFFNHAYENFVSETTSKISIIEKSLQSYLTHDFLREILKLENDIFKYNDYIDFKDYTITIDKTTLNEKIANFRSSLNKLLPSIKAILAEKLNKPHIAIETTVGFNDLFKSTNNIYDDIQTNIILLDPVIAEVTRLKTLAEKDTKEIDNEIESTSKSLKDSEWKLNRIEQDASCKEYLSIKAQIKTKIEIEKKIIDKLEEEQSNYLSKYFTDLDKYYKSFGNGDFSIKKKEDKSKAYKKSYYLDIEYHGKSFTEKDICDLMSESEKRSLALAVFLSKIESEQNCKEMILVLDDPVVSFDVNRIDRSIDVFKELSSKFGQVIIMTHFPMLIEDIANKTTKDHEVSYLEIKRERKYSVIKQADVEVFTNSKLNNQLVRLLAFCKEEHSENILNECRTFIQKFLETRYQKPIREKKLNQNVDFKNFIDTLAKEKIISEDVKGKVNLYRENLNSGSHDFTDPTKIQSARSYVAEVLDYIYSL